MRRSARRIKRAGDDERGRFKERTTESRLGKGSALDIRLLRHLTPQRNEHKILVTLRITVYPSEAAATNPLVVP